MKNLAAIVWLYRGEQVRFLALVKHYLSQVHKESTAIAGTLVAFNKTLTELRRHFKPLLDCLDVKVELEAGELAIVNTATELRNTIAPYEADRDKLIAMLEDFITTYTGELPEANDQQHDVRTAFAPTAERIRGIIRQVDLLYKLAVHMPDLVVDLAKDNSVAAIFDRRAAAKLVRQLDEDRRIAVEQLKQTIYFHRQVMWLQDHFPSAKLEAVPGLVRLVSREDIERADWSLTPGRYVGPPLPEEDLDFDFEQSLRDIRAELADLNTEAAGLGAQIQQDLEELGA